MVRVLRIFRTKLMSEIRNGCAAKNGPQDQCLRFETNDLRNEIHLEHALADVCAARHLRRGGADREAAQLRVDNLACAGLSLGFR